MRDELSGPSRQAPVQRLFAPQVDGGEAPRNDRALFGVERDAVAALQQREMRRETHFLTPATINHNAKT